MAGAWRLRRPGNLRTKVWDGTAYVDPPPGHMLFVGPDRPAGADDGALWLPSRLVLAPEDDSDPGDPPPVLPITAGLTFHLDASQIAGLSDGDPVASWADLSPTGANVSTGTASEQPTYKTGILNGLPVVRFDGGDFLDAGMTAYQMVNASTGEWTAFAVALSNLSTGTPGIVTGDPVSTGGSRVAQFLRYSSLTPQSIAWSGAVTDSGPAVASSGVFRIDEAVRTATTLERFVNAGTDGATTATSPQTAANRIGVGGGTLSTRGSWNGDIAEVLIYNTALSSADRTAVRDYLADKWGVTL